MPTSRSQDAYLRVWEVFRHSGSTADGRHDTPYWRAHSGPYALSIVRVPALALQPELPHLRQDLARLPGIRLHPDHFLHITLQELGFVVETPTRPDEIAAARLEEFAQSAIEPVSSVPPFAVELGGANSFQDAIFLDIRGAEMIAQIHERLFDLAAVPHASPYPYLPHATIGHYDGTTPPAAATSTLQPWRDVVLGGFTISEIEIVTLDPAAAYPEMESYAVIPLES